MGLNPVHWSRTEAPVPYPEALARMEERARAVADGTAPEWLWLLEHPPLFTAGTSARDADLLAADWPVYRTGRGGQFTYHGPGQRIGYVVLDLRRRGNDVRRFVQDLEEWLIRALARVSVTAVRRRGRVGLWIPRDAVRDDKIAAIGIRVRRGVTLHGVSLNVAPNLDHYRGIVPCGISDHGVTSLAARGHAITMAQMDAHLLTAFADIFGPLVADTQHPPG